MSDKTIFLENQTNLDKNKEKIKNTEISKNTDNILQEVNLDATEIIYRSCFLNKKINLNPPMIQRQFAFSYDNY